MKILFINSSPNKNGNTARLVAALLKGHDYETLNLTDYKIYGYGQEFPDDQFKEVIDKMRGFDVIVLGSPVYWHNLSGLMRCFMDRAYGTVRQGEFKGKKLYAVVQGAAPEQWMLDACAYTIKRYAGMYGFDYKGMAVNKAEADKLNF